MRFVLWTSTVLLEMGPVQGGVADDRTVLVGVSWTRAE